MHKIRECLWFITVQTGEYNMKRPCGKCTACCLIHAVREIQKPRNQQCPNCDDDLGCRLHPKHPVGCQTYFCEWANGSGNEDMRPDYFGMIIDMHQTGSYSPRLQISEVTEGALAGTWVKEVTEQMLDAGLYVAHMFLSSRQLLYVPTNVKPSEALLQKLAEDGIEAIFSNTT